MQLIFQSEEFNDLSINELIQKYGNDYNLNILKEIQTEVLLSLKFMPRQLDSRGNKFMDWENGQSRGNFKYDPPLGWIGIGLKVIDIYDDSDNTWIGNKNEKGEWAIAYHAISNVKYAIMIINGRSFKPGSGQAHSNCDDIYHPGKKVGEGVYFTPLIKVVEEYAGTMNIKGKQYKMVIMVRIKPNAIRHCECGDYWVVNGTNDEVSNIFVEIIFKYNL